MNSHRGYTVSHKLQADLEAELTRLGIAYKIVKEPVGFGDEIRPVFVTDLPSPKGWSRYAGCKKCGGGKGLTPSGSVRTFRNCQTCNANYRQDGQSAEELWSILEKNTMLAALGLPEWIKATSHIISVWGVRENLKKKTLVGVGPERETIVSQALDDWRKRVLERLSE